MVQHSEVYALELIHFRCYHKVNVPREYISHSWRVLALALLLIKLGDDGGSNRAFRCSSVFEYR